MRLTDKINEVADKATNDLLKSIKARDWPELAEVIGNQPSDVILERTVKYQFGCIAHYRIQGKPFVIHFSETTRYGHVGTYGAWADRDFWTNPTIIQGIYQQVGRLDDES